ETIQFWIEAKDNKQPTANRHATLPLNVHIGRPASAKEVQEQLAAEKEKQDQLAKNDSPLNPNRPDAPEPRDTDEGSELEKPQPRPDAPEPEQRAKPENRPEENEPEGGAAKPEEGKDGEAREKKPADIPQALQKLVRRDQEKQVGQDK